jgi:hypothetical protein
MLVPGTHDAFAVHDDDRVEDRVEDRGKNGPNGHMCLKSPSFSAPVEAVTPP